MRREPVHSRNGSIEANGRGAGSIERDAFASATLPHRPQAASISDGGGRLDPSGVCAGELDPSRRQDDPYRTVSDIEKYWYADANRTPIALLGIVSSVLLLTGLWMFARGADVLLVFTCFLLLNAGYLFLAYGVILCGATFSIRDHLQRKADVFPRIPAERRKRASVDVFLPVCGEDEEIVVGTWDGVRCLDWPGPVNVYVLDDSPTDKFRLAAERFGFHYVRRPTREFRKAGNLHNAFHMSSGEFILILDADFRPRPEMLRELVPYLLEDGGLAIVQSPQHFEVGQARGWVQAGAGYVQEVFYRLIQPARDKWGAAICVGSCAVYRRAALDEIGGTTLIEHSEDIWTGFQLLDRGWRIKYLPIILAKGTCPESVGSFFTQQYRWCCGSFSLAFSRAFWKSRLTAAQKFCFLGGLFYYLATALGVVLAPLPPAIMTCFYPQVVHWAHLGFSLPNFVFATLVQALWSRHRFGLHYLTTREVASVAHLSAVVDSLRGGLMGWVVTGTRNARKNRRLILALTCVLGVSGAAALATWFGTLRALVDPRMHWLHFIPPVVFAWLHVAFCWRILFPPDFSEAPDHADSAEIPAQSRRRLRAAAAVVVPCLAGGLSALWLSLATPPLDPISRQILRAELWRRPSVAQSAVDLAEWGVVDAFDGVDGLAGAMQIRQHPLDDDKYLVATYHGRILELARDGRTWRASPLVDLAEGDLGWLFSFAFHPQFGRDNQKLYVMYASEGPEGQHYRVSEIVLGRRTPATAVDETVLIEQAAAHEEHLGGSLEFDDQRFLLISVGDNGRRHDDSANSQRIDRSLFSGILRIDVDRRGGLVSHPPRIRPFGARTQGYFIPSDNPFVGQDGALEEFWAIGLRNPFRISFDHPTKALWIGEVGQDRIEQVEVATAGTNHLWSFREGSLDFTRSYLEGHAPTAFHGRPTQPVFEYPHEDQNYCIIGGFIYRGREFPELAGRYIFGDLQSGRVWTLDPEHPDRRELLLQLPFTKHGSSLVSIGTDREGNIFFTNVGSNVAIYKLVRTRQVHFPEWLSKTGLFADVQNLEPAEGFLPYDVNVPLWSDGMQKRRWIKVPHWEPIGNTGEDWVVPAGTIFIKHFDLPPEARGSHNHLKIETRILIVKEDGHVLGASYRWNAEGTDAELQLHRDTIPVALDSPDRHLLYQSSLDQSTLYQIPGFRDCVLCHNRVNPVLGFNLRQLNRAEAGGTQNQLVSLSSQEVFEQPYEHGEIDQLPRLVPLQEARASLEERARSYLHANCSYCHFPESMQRVSLDLRITAPLDSADLVGAPAKTGYMSIDGRRARHVISPGDPGDSALYLRMATKDSELGMPFRGRSTPDTQALNLIEEWILSLQ